MMPLLRDNDWWAEFVESAAVPFTWDTSRFATPPREGPLSEQDTARLNARIAECDALLVALAELPELDPDRTSRVLMYKAMACAEVGCSDDAMSAITEAARVATATVRQLHDLAGVLVREGHLEVALGVEELALGHSVDDAERWGQAVRARERMHVFLSAAYLGEATAAAQALDDLLELGDPALIEVQMQASRFEHKPPLLVSLLLAEIQILANLGRQAESDAKLHALIDRFGNDPSPEVQDLLIALRAQTAFEG
jgi:hypothetical protein